MRAVAGLTLAGMLWAGSALAGTFVVDARQPPSPPLTGQLKMGTGVSPAGQAIAVNSRYLTIGGRPAVPVMGEFHFTRFPAEHWDEQLRKMKAAGVNVVATYVIWQHIEDRPGVFDWTGDRDLRRFIQLAQKNGLYVYLRPGPWVHAEVRFGGIPDYVVDATYPRSNDPAYLAYVERFIREVAAQSRGLLWKDGGPVIGVQIENEYNRAGPMQGREHIARLKQIFVDAGFDTPLYTVTGWDNAVFPRGEVIPVWGSYVDEPWSASASILPPKTSYLFQFGVRDEKGLGAQGSTSREVDGARDADITPFFGAEYGGGVPQMYRRRPLIAPDDIADMVVAKLGSGVNLLGYYMFQGGQNPPGSPSRDESVASGGFNDVPKLGYDFQAPLGQYGQAHPVLGALRPLHYFLEAFGERLAPTEVYAPAIRPADAGDLKTLRWAFRGDGRRGFVFVNNHVRQYETPEHRDVQFRVELADGAVIFPAGGVTVEKGDAFIWPVRFDLSGVELAWATAQPVTRIDDGAGDLYVFAVSGRIAPQFAFQAGEARKVAGAAGVTRSGGEVLVRARPGGIVSVTSEAGRTARILLVTAEQSRKLAKVEIRGRPYLVLSEAHAFGSSDGGLELRQTAPGFRLGLYPKPPALGASLKLTAAGREGVFHSYAASAPAVTLKPEVQLARPAGKAPPNKMYGPRNTPVVPEPETFGASAAWSVRLPAQLPAGVSDVFMDVAYEGDVARLFAGPQMLDDEYYIGRPWRIGLKRYVGRLDQPLTLTIMPLRQDSKVHFDPSVKPRFDDGQAARLDGVTLTPEYALILRWAPGERRSSTLA